MLNLRRNLGEIAFVFVQHCKEDPWTINAILAIGSIGCIYSYLRTCRANHRRLNAIKQAEIDRRAAFGHGLILRGGRTELIDRSVRAATTPPGL
jgi:hypothetical protein